ncbi:MAG: alginate export family protein [Phycisphaeraceae bacterium]|nr:alginate export family protein [Phycisphaeraceae bacterium]
MHNFFVRGSSTYRDFHGAAKSFDTHGDDWQEFQLDRAVYRFDLSRFMSAYKGQAIDTNVILEAGRQYIRWFNGLVFSNELDALVLTIEHDKLTFKALAGTTTRRTIDIDSARPNYDTDTHRNFYAGALSYRISERHMPFIYGMVQKDHNNEGSNFDGTYTTNFDYESWYIGAGSQGTFSDQLIYNVELVYQGGRGLSSAFDGNYAGTPQTYEDIAAYALAANLTYLFKGDNKSHVDGEIILASGDDDRLATSSTYGGNQSGSRDTAFNAFGSMDTGLAFASEVSNLMMIRLGASTFPLINHESFKRLQVGTNIYLYGKLNKNAPIEEASTNHTFLGVETDFFANWQITNDLSMSARYGIFFGGEALTNNSNPRNFFFTSFTLAF